MRGNPGNAMARIMPLTTVQRDILQFLLTQTVPIGSAVIAEHLDLTARQVQYGLRDIRYWLEQQQVTIRHIPGVGIHLHCTEEQRQQLLARLASYRRFQLVLTPEQRQQLLAFQLLTASSPLTINQLQEELAVARATVLKDIDIIESWFEQVGLALVRRQHRGCWLEGAEWHWRQALVAFLWGDLPVERPVCTLYQHHELKFTLAHDEALLPLLQRMTTLLDALDLTGAHTLVAEAETMLGGRFSDTAAAALALLCAVQQWRIQMERYVQLDSAILEWLQPQRVWLVAVQLSDRSWPALTETQRLHEATLLALHMVSSARDQPWESDLGTHPMFQGVIDRMRESIAAAYHMPALAQDRLLQAGLEAHILPACVRQRFQLWAPPATDSDTHHERYATERAIAVRLANTVASMTGTNLPDDVTADLILLLRAAVLRVRPERARRVLVVCPSGMATTQLLVARLRARLPRLGTLEVLPMREVTSARIDDADLIISTVPLSLPKHVQIDVIQVHPMLQPDDLVRLTNWMNR